MVFAVFMVRLFSSATIFLFFVIANLAPKKIAAPPPEKSTQQPAPSTPASTLAIKRTMSCLGQAAAHKDEPGFWAAYLVRFLNADLIKQLVDGGIAKSIEYFKGIDPNFVTVVQNNHEWFSEMFDDLKDIVKEKADESKDPKNRKPGDPPGGPGNADNA